MFKKDLFDQSLKKYKSNLFKKGLILPYKWEVVRVFLENWNIQAADFLDMYQRSIDESSEVWSLPVIEAKKAMILMIEINEDLVKNMFNDLFNENLAVEGRIDRFIYHCDIIVDEINAKKVKPSFHNHNKWMITFYLSCRYPEKYCPFHYQPFHSTMYTLGSRSIPSEYETERYYKIMRIFTKFIYEDQEIHSYILSLKDNIPAVSTRCIYIADDFCERISAIPHNALTK